ncbi:hypothetical protein HU200_046287 [Digitaria exilis]|uniref:Uncharacterized protein n=1 Tax=Digitaria exilis TaxID=1010633 RepID=A0A835B9T9_9POAL|nr:hypothetical protein HU200_046287 [Digitaria exilis]
MTLIKEEMKLRSLACREDVFPFVS